ncbi:hypothetical protein BX600DRAFT_535025 [Xylariales sp. PMI_506]|nr:hypothetical protein BX600DRAFT_535025 [Xylariales sp. PMI_506]
MTKSSTGLEAHILLLATCDTKMEEIGFVHSRISSLHPQYRLTLADIGRNPTQNALITASQAKVFAAASSSSSDRREGEEKASRAPPLDLGTASRGEYSEAMSAAATAYARSLHHKLPLHGVLGIGGSTGSSIAAAAMRDAFPVGLPKLLVSTMASGDVGHLVGGADLTLTYSVVDIAGLNFISERVLGNAAAAVAGMAGAYAASLGASKGREQQQQESEKGRSRKKRVAITMFGVTTPGVDKIRAILTAPPHNAEVVVFHATGSGGRAMEALIRDGDSSSSSDGGGGDDNATPTPAFDAVIDLTTTEIADEIGGGILSAGPDRLRAACAAGIPLVVSVGACDMINFGPRATVPARILEQASRSEEDEGQRKLYVHNPAVTLLRTTRDENRRIARFMVDRLLGVPAAARPLVAVALPTRALSMISGVGGPFEDREADEELFRGLEEGLKGSGIEVARHDVGINDQEFAEQVVETLSRLQAKVS